MILRGIERVKTMKLGLDLGTIGQGKTHPAQHLDRAVLGLGERMQRPRGQRPRRQSKINTLHGLAVSLISQLRLLLLDGGSNRLPRRVEQLAHLRFVLFGKILHACGCRREAPLLAQISHAGIIKGLLITRSRNSSERISLDRFDFLIHRRRSSRRI